MTYAIIVAALLFAYAFAFMRGYKRGYEFARSLVGRDKLPPYDKLHEELP